MIDGWPRRRTDDAPVGAGTLVDLLEARAAAPSGGYSFLRDGEAAAEDLGLPELAGRARAIAAILQTQAAPGTRALLLYPPGLSFLPAFFGCLYARIVAVPAPPPEDARLRHSLPRLLAILRDAEPGLVLTTAPLRDRLTGRLGGDAARLPWLVTDDVGFAVPGEWTVPALDPDNLAYLQYTSGSTASPRGVMLTHGRLLHNLAHLRRGFVYGADSRSVTWMPHFHDYGLVEGLLQPLYSDLPCQVLSPLTILRRPLRWLQAMDRHRATHTHAPNFAYELCVQRIAPEQRRGLDLSRWRVAGNGAEPIRAETLRRFAEAFAPCGFRAGAFFPAYGLAEATLFVTARPAGRPMRQCALDAAALGRHCVLPAPPGDPAPRIVVSCGAPQLGTDLRIVDPETRRACGPDQVGEVWVADPSVAAGYWGRPEDTAATFCARLAQDPAAGPFLRTGDLGFLRDGELHVTGRLKDVIVVAGANHYPQDIEATVEQGCPEVRRGHCVAFAMTLRDEERVGILVEPEDAPEGWDALLRRIRRLVAEHHGLAAGAVTVVRRGGILKTSSGKLQRQACRTAFLAGGLDCLAAWQEPAPAAPIRRPPRYGAEELGHRLCDALGEALGLDPRTIDPQVPFAEYGLDSRRALALVAELGEWLREPGLDPGLLWQHPTVAALSAHLTGRTARRREAAAPAPVTADARSSCAEPVAIIGIACRFPGAPDPEAFWTLLREGRSAIEPNPRLPGIEAGFLPDVEGFDAEFFGLSASEARAMDPQQRLMLEVAWEALEDAGLAPRHLAKRRIGVWVGISSDDHSYRQFGRADAAALITAHSGPGLAHCMAANRVSYLLDLRGPSMAIDTACSSSLVAVHQACQSLRSGETEAALAGGVNLILAPQLQLALQRAGMLSPEQRCKTFDGAADGYVRGEGCGVVVLKRLSDAARDGDAVLAVIRGSAVNQDGRSNGLTAPNPQAQEAVIREALARAGLDPADVDYVETHGTGTKLGDPIEIGALQAVLGAGRPAERHCLLGSVKTNIGHLEAAAGIAGLVKAVLALRHGEVPPHLNLRSLNPLLRLAGTPFRLPSGLTPWPERPCGRRLAAVSSFGFGGTNAHVLVEAPPPAAAEDSAGAVARRPVHLLVLSARGEPALRALAGRHAEALAHRPDLDLSALCAATATRRAHHPDRLALRARDAAGLAARLRAFASGEEVSEAVTGRAAAQPPAVVFLFTGQGAQYLGMGRRLYATEPVFRDILDTCDAELREVLDPPLLSVLFGDAPALLDRTDYTQPALFAVEYALARLWQHWGIEPAAVLGHSVGEYVAACLAGVFDLPTGLRLIAARGRMIARLPPGGAMLAVAATEEALRDAMDGLTGRVAVAAVNAPRSTVLSGERGALEGLSVRLAGQGIGCRFLPVSHAFHSPLLDPVLEEFRGLAAGCRFAPPRLPWIGNCNGRPVEGAPDAEYWTRHMREPVRFADGLRALDALLPPDAGRVFLEIGPRPVLGPVAAQALGDPRLRWLPSLDQGRDDWEVLLGSLAGLYVAGAMPDWERALGEAPRRPVPGLPTYPFQRRPHGLPPLDDGHSAGDAVQVALGWGDPPAAPPAAPPPVRAAAPGVILGMIERGDVEGLARRLAPGLAPEQRAGLDPWLRVLVEAHRREVPERAPPSWLHRVEWEERPWRAAPPRQRPQGDRWLILADASGCGARLRDRLQDLGVQAVFRPADAQATGGLDLPLAEPGLVGVVHLGALDAPSPEQRPAASLLQAQVQAGGAVLGLLPALLRRTGTSAPRLWLVTQGATSAPGAGPHWRPDQATLWGLGRVVGLEHPELWGGLVDLSPDLDARDQAETLAAALLAPEGEDQIALRAGRRLVPRLRAVAAEAMPDISLRSDATYLVTGGLGALGLRLARWMAERGARHIALLGCSAPSEAARRELAALERDVAQLRILQGDIALETEMAGLLASLRQTMPPLRGLVHAAAVLDDGLLLRLDPARLEAVLAPKLAGAWTLHRLTRDLPLDFFVLFSSATALLGWQGQGSYAAANAGLDALAQHRRRLGLPALSIDWGPWAGIGAAAALDQRLAGRWERRGLSGLEPEQGLQALGWAMRQDAAQLAVLSVDWDRFARTAPPGAVPGLLAALLPDALPAAPPPVTRRGALREALALALPSERRGLLLARIRAEIAGILGVPEARIADERQGLFDMGFDSLMALELKNRLEAAAGQRLSPTLAFDCPSMGALAAHLLGLLAPAAPALAAAPDDALPDGMLAEIAQLSDRDIEALVDAELQRSLQ